MRGARRARPARARVGHGLRLRRLLRLRRAAARRRLPARCASTGPVLDGALLGGGARRIDAPIDFCGLRLGAPDRQRLGHLRRHRRAARLRRRAARAASRSRPSSPRRSRWRRATATRRRACTRPPAGLINSIGLPNKGLRGYLEHDLPELARLPVPLITNVMGSTAAELVRAGRGARRARRGRRARAQRLLPERLDRPRHRRRPRRAGRRPGARCARGRPSR